MKIILATTFLLITSIEAFAQWTGTNPIYYNGGNVGIGNSTPTSKLQILNTTNITATDKINLLEISTEVNSSNVGAKHGIKFSGRSTGGGFLKSTEIYNVSEADWNNENGLAFHTNGLERLRIKHNGNIGIGTSSPNEKLHVDGNITIPVTKMLGWDVSAAKFTYSGNTIGSYGIGWAIDSWHPTAPTGNFSGFGGLKFFTGNQPRLVIKNNGWVGINHDNPAHALDVAGNVAGNAFNFKGAWNNAQILGSGETIEYRSSWYHGFYALNSSTPVMFLDARAGKLGIGTNQPDAPLTVKGVIHTNEVKVDMESPIQGPDYVFEENYELVSLQDIEAYIKANKHLPEVPSAKELFEDGLHLKEMNLLLLKKVEELTLHMIQQQKETEELKKEIVSLKEKNMEIENKLIKSNR